MKARRRAAAPRAKAPVDETADRSDLYERIYAVVREIPAGRIASYGQIARIVGCGPRVVGYAMAALPSGNDVPWHRVVNSEGRVSARKGGGEARQKRLLRAEGHLFDKRGRLDLEQAGWRGPSWAWLASHGYEPTDL